jgi:hypothetical protein
MHAGAMRRHANYRPACQAQMHKITVNNGAAKIAVGRIAIDVARGWEGWYKVRAALHGKSFRM